MTPDTTREKNHDHDPALHLRLGGGGPVVTFLTPFCVHAKEVPKLSNDIRNA
jgi:hypothetical protein